MRKKKKKVGTIISPEGKRVTVYAPVCAFARKINIRHSRLFDLLKGRRASCKGWYSTTAPRAKSLFKLRRQKMINLSTRQIIQFNLEISKIAKDIDASLRKLESLRYNEGLSTSGWIMLDTYELIYNDPDQFQRI